MTARLWSPLIRQSRGKCLLPGSGRDDQTRILGSLPSCPVTIVSMSFLFMSSEQMSSSWP